MAYMKKLFPQVREFFFDDDTFTANLPRAREIAKKLGPLGLTWSLQQSREPRLRHDQKLQGQRPALAPGRYEVAMTKPHTIKKGVTTDEMRRFTKDCHKAGVVIHGTFILVCRWRPGKPSSKRSSSHRSWTCSACKSASPRRIPAPNFTSKPGSMAGFVKKDKTDLVENDGFSKAPGISRLSKEEIFESVERFYHRYYLRPKPILRILKTMLEDKDVCVRRLREGYEFFKSWRNGGVIWKR